MAATVSCAVCRIEQSKPRWGPFEVRRAKVRDGATGAPRRKCALPRRICRSGYSRRIGSMRCCRLRGVSTGDFQKALAALLGKDTPNLSPAVISWLTAEWQADYDAWQKRDLSARRYVYVWADGVYLQARMEEAAKCMLVLAGATPEGKKELVGFQTGVREGARSWRELLIDIKQRGLGDCAAPGGRRARLLEGDRGGLSEHQALALLGSRDRQRAEQGRSRGPGQHEGRPSRDLHRADPLLLNPLRSRRALYYSCSARKVSQLPTLPAFKPVMNQRERCAEVPWVNASGTT
jgi:Transposase, Mutator family